MNLKFHKRWGGGKLKRWNQFICMSFLLYCLRSFWNLFSQNWLNNQAGVQEQQATTPAWLALKLSFIWPNCMYAFYTWRDRASLLVPESLTCSEKYSDNFQLWLYRYHLIKADFFVFTLINLCHKKQWHGMVILAMW